MKEILLYELAEKRLTFYKGNTKRTWKTFIEQVLKVYAPAATNLFSEKEFIDFKNLLINEGYSNNAIVGFIDKIKALLRAAARARYEINSDDLMLMKHEGDESNAIALSNEEVKKIHKLQLNKLDETIKDYFIIGCLTGLRFSDFTRLTWEKIKNGKLTVNTQKKNTVVVIPVHKFIILIFKKYNYILPKAPSNACFNEHLPFIAAMTGMRGKETYERKVNGVMKSFTLFKYEMVKTHTARRTAATNMYLAGIPVFRIMLITGHATEQSFFKYIRIGKNENADVLADNSFFK